MSGRRLSIAVWHNLPPGGARRSLVAQVAGLLDRGHLVQLWSPPPLSGSELMPFDPRAVQHVSPLASHPLKGQGYAAKMGRYLTGQRHSIDAMREHSQVAAQEMASAGCDVLLATNCVQFHSPFIGRYFSGPKALYLQDPKRKLYTADQRLIWRALGPAPSGTSLKSRLGRTLRDKIDTRDARQLAELDYWNTKSFDRILVNSFFSRESLLRAYNLDSTVCYLGIDGSLFRVFDGEKQPFVIGVGAIAANKNVDFIVESLSTIQNKRPKLVWIGQFAEAEYRHRLEKLASAKKVELELKVELPDCELVELLGRASAFVYAPRLEPFGFAPLEANACGTLVVSIPEGGMRESIVDGVNGFLVVPDPSSFGNKISWLLDRPQVAKDMGHAAAAHVAEKWTWNRSIDQLEFELRSLMNP